LTTLDEIYRANNQNNAGKDIRQICEVAEKVDYAETTLNLDNELCADGRQR
jgi:hypothetical protein